MTESEWQNCPEPAPMLVHLRGVASDRKLRLFAGACCRRIWPHLTSKRSRWLVDVSEWYAEGRATRDRLTRAWEKADGAYQGIHLAGGGDIDQIPAQAVLGLGPELDAVEVAEMAATTLGAAARGDAYARIWQEPGKTHDQRWAEDDAVRAAGAVVEARAQAVLARDVFGNPFCLVATDPGWLTDAVFSLADSIYAQKAFDRMTILADALEDAGCDHPDVLAHCRVGQLHVTGCWVLDLLLGKA